jgi:multimeric flavodoxin WrbA
MDGNKRILAINGSYRDGGATDQAVESLVAALEALGASAEEVRLRDYPIEFCLNCRECMQQPGTAPGRCVHDDGMAALVRQIEAADGYVLAAPTNFSSVTALFKRFQERLAVYGYWPWGKPAPVYRKAKAQQKPAVIIWSCAAPGLLGRLTYSTSKNLNAAAEAIGGKVVGSIVTGLVSRAREPGLPLRTQRRARKLAPKLVA